MGHVVIDQGSERHKEWIRESVLSSTSHLVIATDTLGKVLLFNSSSEKTIGYTEDEIVGTHTPALWHDPDEVAQRAKELTLDLGERILPGFDVFTKIPLLRGREIREWTFIRKNKSRFKGRLTVTVLKDSWGHPCGFLGVIEDLTERRKAEEKVTAQQKEMQLILSRIPAHIWYKDLDNRILGLSERAARSMNGNPKDFIGKRVEELTDPKIAAQYHAVEKQIIRSAKPQLGVIERYEPNNGSPGWFRTDKIPYVDKATGKPCVLIIAQDITELKESQDALRRLLKHLTQSKEVKDLKAHLKGLGLLLRDIKSEAMSDSLKKQMENLVSLTQAIKTLMEKLLTFK